MRILWIAPLCLTLAACGGGDAPIIATPTAPTTPTTPTSPPVDESGADMRSSANTLLATYADPVVFTALSDIPSSHTATYNGYAYGDLSNGSDAITDTLIGQLSLNISLTSSNATVTGTIDNFADDNDDAVTGTLTVSNGSFDRSGDPNADATFKANFTGTLTDNASRSLSVGGLLEGDFLGSDPDAIGGNLLGSVTVSGVTQDIDGGFIAED